MMYDNEPVVSTPFPSLSPFPDFLLLRPIEDLTSFA